MADPHRTIRDAVVGAQKVLNVISRTSLLRQCNC
jgi:hypothetical protein